MRHFLKRSSYSSGSTSSTRWPTAKVTIHSSFSQWVSAFSNRPGSASTMSRATEGFSARIRVFTRPTIATGPEVTDA